MAWKGAWPTRRRTALIVGALCFFGTMASPLVRAQTQEQNPIRRLCDFICGKPGDKITAQDRDKTKEADARVTIRIQIAPMLKAAADGSSNANLPANSAFTDVGDGFPLPAGGFANFDSADSFTDVNLGTIQKAIFKRIGITPCDTEPDELKGKDGEQDFIETSTSEVLNPGGSRTTFGYFIKFKYDLNYDPKRPVPDEATYLALFSYDKIKFKELVKLPICATEFFLFKYKGVNSRGELLSGLAIGSQGQRLKEVPLDLARVSNFLSPGHKDETVKPSVYLGQGVASGQGCMICHGGVPKHPVNAVPQYTLPFPWTRKP
jgi:hypothetical protein